MNRGGEHAGDAAGKWGEDIRVAGQLPQRRGRLIDVLGERVIPVGAPYLMWQVPLVPDLQPCCLELFEQAGRAQCCGRQVLARRVAGRAARNTHD